MLQRQCFFDQNQLLLIFSRFHSMRIQVESFVDWSFKAWFYDIDPISSAEVGWKSMPRCQVCSNEHRIFYSKEFHPKQLAWLDSFGHLMKIFFFQNPAIWSLGCVVSSEGKHFGRGLNAEFSTGLRLSQLKIIVRQVPTEQKPWTGCEDGKSWRNGSKRIGPMRCADKFHSILIWIANVRASYELHFKWVRQPFHAFPDVGGCGWTWTRHLGKPGLLQPSEARCRHRQQGGTLLVNHG